MSEKRSVNARTVVNQEVAMVRVGKVDVSNIGIKNRYLMQIGCRDQGVPEAQ